MAKTNKTKYALLGVLNQIKSGSGYDIKKFCDISISNFWNENYGHIYPVLKQMEAEGLVVKQTEYTEGRPPKNVFSITESGTGELNQWLQQTVEHDPVRSEILLKLFFAESIPKENIIQMIKKEKEAHERKRMEFIETEKNLKTSDSVKNEPGLPFWLACVSNGKYLTEATIKWCDETLKALDQVNLEHE